MTNSEVQTEKQIFSLDGLTTEVSDPVSTAFGYDSMGNITSIAGDEDLEIKYNLLNLPKEIKKSGTVVSKYAYLSDGKKVSSCDADGNGYMYFGAARFTLDNDVPTFESIPFSGGRIVKTTNGYEPQYYQTDHLGSTRMIVNKDGKTVEATFDYTPFGVQITGASLPTNSTEYRFSGKELQNISDYEIYDFGARQYFPKYAVWGSVDPLAGSFADVSPFAYCNNNPVLFVDPNGMAWYSYVVKDEDGNEVKKYYYSEKKLTKKQEKEGGYTYLGDTYITDDTYYSLNGGEVKYDKNNAMSLFGVAKLMNRDSQIIGTEVLIDFLYDNKDLIGDVLNIVTQVNYMIDVPMVMNYGGTVCGLMCSIPIAVKDFISLLNGELDTMGKVDAIMNVVSMAGVPGATIASTYSGIKKSTDVLVQVEFASRDWFKGLQDQYVRMMSY